MPSVDELLNAAEVAEATLTETNGTQEQEQVARDYYNQLEAELLIVANEQKVELEKKAQEVIKTIPSDYTQMQKDVNNLKEDRVNKIEFMNIMQTVFGNIADIRAYLGITADDIVGIQVDYKNKTFKRLAGAANLTKGSDFDKFTMFGGRSRHFGGRLVYIPTRDSATYTAAIEAWKQKMAA